MILSGLFGLCVGLLLGGRFNALAIIPAQIVAVAVLLAPVFLNKASFPHQILLGVAFCLALQGGYVVRLVSGIAPPQPAPLKTHQV